MVGSNRRKANTAASAALPVNSHAVAIADTTIGASLFPAAISIFAGSGEGCTQMGGHTRGVVVQYYKSDYDANFFVCGKAWRRTIYVVIQMVH